MNQSRIEKIVSELQAVADVDFMDMSFIAESVREDLNLKKQHDIRCQTLNIIDFLMKRGVYPGDYNHATSLSFWSGEPCEHLRRIEAEWIAMGHTPTLEHPICWFGLKRSDPA